MIIDSHLHVWDRSRSAYAWLADADPRLQPSLGLADVAAELTAAGVGGVVLVQADDTVEETEYLLEVAADEPRVLGVVGYLPLHDPAAVADLLPRWLAEPRLVGIRTLSHDRPDPDWVLRPEVDAGIALVAAAGLPLDHVAVLPRHLAHTATLARRHPGLRIVLDHLGSPPFGADAPRWQEWETLLRDAAAQPGVVAKVSGLYHPEPGSDAAVAELDRAVDVALDCFGPDRLMYGGDWPVSLPAGGYTPAWQALQTSLARHPGPLRDRVLHRTAAEVYRLPVAADGTLR